MASFPVLGLSQERPLFKEKEESRVTGYSGKLRPLSSLSDMQLFFLYGRKQFFSLGGGGLYEGVATLQKD